MWVIRNDSLVFPAVPSYKRANRFILLIEYSPHSLLSYSSTPTPPLLLSDDSHPDSIINQPHNTPSIPPGPPPPLLLYKRGQARHTHTGPRGIHTREEMATTRRPIKLQPLRAALTSTLLATRLASPGEGAAAAAAAAAAGAAAGAVADTASPNEAIPKPACNSSISVSVRYSSSSERLYLESADGSTRGGCVNLTEIWDDRNGKPPLYAVDPDTGNVSDAATGTWLLTEGLHVEDGITLQVLLIFGRNSSQNRRSPRTHV